MRLAHEDFEVMRTIVEAAQFTPGLWLLNRLAEVWFDAAATLRFALRPPDNMSTIMYSIDTEEPITQ